MTVSLIRRFALAIGCNVLVYIGSAFAQQPFHSLRLLVEQNPQASGVSNFRLSVFPYPVAGEPGARFTAIAPDGAEFDSFSGSFIMGHDHFSDLATQLFGDWTVNIENTSLGPLVSYQVRVEPFSLNDVFSETPLVISPLNGSQVPTDFVVKWQYPGSAVPASAGIGFTGGPNIAIIDRHPGIDGPSSQQVQTRIIGPRPAILSFRVNASTFLDNPQVVSRDASLADKSINSLLTFTTHSLQTQIEVVPEPSTGIILAVLLAPIMAAVRSHKLRTRR